MQIVSASILTFMILFAGFSGATAVAIFTIYALGSIVGKEASMKGFLSTAGHRLLANPGFTSWMEAHGWKNPQSKERDAAIEHLQRKIERLSLIAHDELACTDGDCPCRVTREDYARYRKLDEVYAIWKKDVPSALALLGNMVVMEEVEAQEFAKKEADARTSAEEDPPPLLAKE